MKLKRGLGFQSQFRLLVFECRVRGGLCSEVYKSYSIKIEFQS